MNFYAILVELTIALMIISFIQWITAPEKCPKCGSDMIPWDDKRSYCNNPKCKNR